LNELDPRTITAPLEEAGVSYGAQVGDFGCGIGVRTAYTAKYVCSGHVVAIDLHEHLLEEARKSCRDMGVTNVTFVASAAESTPLPDSSLDCVRLDSVLWAVDQPLSVLREVRRVLRTQGTVLMYNHDSAGLFYCHYPPMPDTVSNIFGKCSNQLHKWGADLFIGRKLPFLAREAGFAVESTTVSVRLVGRDRAMEHWRFFEQWLPGFTHEGCFSLEAWRVAAEDYVKWVSMEDWSSLRIGYHVRARKI
jgi:SAM-dependent methyltransferase